MEIYLVRHTKVAVSSDICYGISDVELAPHFEEDIRQVKSKLADLVFDKVYASPLKRCGLLANHLSETVDVAWELLEMNFGLWEMKRWDEIDRKALDVWMNDFTNQRPSTGECLTDFAMKSVMFFDRLVRESASADKIALVTHSGPIRSIVCHVLNMSLNHSFNFDIDFGSITKIEVKDGWYKVKYLNL
ncbi:MAG: alpha-ribazole phosphatase [Cyclobacteriaceae bacterium]|nr:alpha-ribazole phosphatase [Cyclobacteriaceae bacterium]